MTLRNLQKKFVDSVLTEDNTAMEPALNTKQISADGLMGIYRNNTVGGISTAIELTYPVVHKLVGCDFFAYCCQEFLKKYYPLSGNLDDYGEEFSAFLSIFPPAASLEYLPDVATLEWIFHQSAIAEKGDTLDIDAVAQIPQDKYFNLHFILHPSLYLFTSKFPVHLIWEMNQEGVESNKNINLDEEGGVHVMLIRARKKVDIMVITPAEFAFIKSLQDGESFYNSFAAAGAVDEEFDLEFYLKKHINTGIFSGFSL